MKQKLFSSDELPEDGTIRPVVYVDKISDLGDIAGHCMLAVGRGIFFHARLGLLIVDKSSLPQAISAHLPE